MKKILRKKDLKKEKAKKKTEMYGSKKVSEIEYIPVLVTFFCPHDKIFCKSNLRKEDFTLVHSSKA